MIRKLMASSALVALISAGAISVSPAQTDPAKPAVTQDTAAAQDTTVAPTQDTTVAPVIVAESSQAIAPAHPTLASTIIGRSVYSSADPQSDNIGDVNDLIVDEKGAVTHAVVGVGGFLGIGEKNVAVPFDQLKVMEENGDFRLVYAATKEQLESAPAFDRTAYDPAARAPKPADTAATDTTMAPASSDMAATPPVEAPAPADQAATAPPADSTAPADDLAAAPAAQDTTAPADTTASADNAAPVETTEPLPADVGFLNASAEQVRASTLIGKSVYGPENESIGQIADLILEKQGNTRVALIDVGGFLGVGEKTVAIPFADLKLVKAEGADASAEPQITVAMTKDQLQSEPAFDTSTLDKTAAAEPTAPTTTDQTATPAASDTIAAAPATTDQTNAPAPATTDTMAAAPATTDQAEPSATGAINGVETPQELAASSLMGAEVYGTDDSDIGEISDIVFDMKGDIDAVVVDVGGFLGIGEKPVALNFDNLNVRTDESGKFLVSVNATKDQLDKAPAFEVSSIQ